MLKWWVLSSQTGRVGLSEISFIAYFGTGQARGWAGERALGWAGEKARGWVGEKARGWVGEMARGWAGERARSWVEFKTSENKTFSRRTIIRMLSNAGFVSRRCVKKPLLSQKNIRQNKVFARIWKVWFRVVQQSCVEWWIKISVAC